ncbi:MAG: polyprenyl synthetase family protein [Nitrospirota bacterium]
MKVAIPTNTRLTMDEVWELCREDLHRIEDQIHTDLKSNLSLISVMVSHLINSGGKRLRPLLMILASRLAGYTGKSHIELASVIELIHAATLFHDDVIDDAPTRRGNKTARMLWGNQASILVGDYLYAKAQCTIVSFHNHDLNESVTEATRKMAKGELAQLAFNGDLSITEEDYLEIIGNKTASLMAATCRIGAILGECSTEQRNDFELFGWNVGMAFQLADDTLDYAANKAKLGKSVGKDLGEGKVTLPLLALLKRCSQNDAEKIERLITLSEVTEENLSFILNLMKEYGVIEYSLEIARSFVEKAKKSLSFFEDPIPLQALFTVADYVVEREL